MKHVKVSTLSQSALRFASLANPVVRELRETDYQFAKPFILDSSAMSSTFGVQPTPWDDGLRSMVETYQTKAR
jgi:hypothetical protein